MLITRTTLCLLIKDNKILLPIKKRGFGKGKNNGVGGKLEDGETELEAMIRETKEEIGVDVMSGSVPSLCACKRQKNRMNRMDSAHF